jgi:hypothetical protein
VFIIDAMIEKHAQMNVATHTVYRSTSRVINKGLGEKKEEKEDEDEE